MANLAADLSSLGFASGAGITPGRLLRIAHALTRATIMTLGGAQLACLRYSAAVLIIVLFSVAKTQQVAADMWLRRQVKACTDSMRGQACSGWNFL